MMLRSCARTPSATARCAALPLPRSSLPLLSVCRRHSPPSPSSLPLGPSAERAVFSAQHRLRRLPSRWARTSATRARPGWRGYSPCVRRARCRRAIRTWLSPRGARGSTRRDERHRFLDVKVSDVNRCKSTRSIEHAWWIVYRSTKCSTMIYLVP